MKLLIHSRGDFASQSRASEILGLITSFIILATIMVVLRFYTKVKIVRATSADDWFILAAGLSAISMTICNYKQVHYGLGRHIQTLTVAETAQNMKWLYISIQTYSVSIVLTKVSILVAYLRFFQQQPKTLLATRIVLVFVVLYWLWSFLFQVFGCSPIAYFWDKSILGGHCRNGSVACTSYSAYNMASDLIILVIPIPALYSLSIAHKLKLWLLSAFALGGFVFLVTLVRILRLHKLLSSTDPTWDNAASAYWSCIEVDVAIICACVPPLRALVVIYFPQHFSEAIQNDVTLNVPTFLEETAK